MKIQDKVLVEVTNEDIVDGTFAIPSSIKEIGGWAFADCTSLTHIIIPDSVKWIGLLAFRGCTSLTSIVLSPSVTEIDDEAFLRCTSLASIVIPDSVEVFGDNAFRGCHNLTNIIAPEHIKKEIEWQATLARFAQPNEKIAQKFQELRDLLK
jgi:hypothetical protein